MNAPNYKITVANLRFFIIILFSVILFAYPVWRLGGWLALPPAPHIALTLLFFSSQWVARFVLRNRLSALANMVRRAADFCLGLSPVLLCSVLIAELLLVFTSLSPSIVAWGVIAALVMVAIIGVWAAWAPKVVKVALSSDKIKQPVRFVQISDVHIGSRTERFLAQVMSRVQALDPDFLCITGDFIDQPEIGLDTLKPLADFDKPIYFCTGNHERYEDHDAILLRLRTLGVKVLENQLITTPEGLQMVGISDSDNPKQVEKVLSTMPKINQQAYTILLYHRPQGIEAAAAHGVDLKLSGHTHNGQIIPFNQLVKRQFDYVKGLYQYQNAHLYVNEGTGTWGPILRLGTRSEITLFKLSPPVGQA